MFSYVHNRFLHIARIVLLAGKQNAGGALETKPIDIVAECAAAATTQRWRI